MNKSWTFCIAFFLCNIGNIRCEDVGSSSESGQDELARLQEELHLYEMERAHHSATCTVIRDQMSKVWREIWAMEDQIKEQHTKIAKAKIDLAAKKKEIRENKVKINLLKAELSKSGNESTSTARNDLVELTDDLIAEEQTLCYWTVKLTTNNTELEEKIKLLKSEMDGEREKRMNCDVKRHDYYMKIKEIEGKIKEIKAREEKAGK